MSTQPSNPPPAESIFARLQVISRQIQLPKSLAEHKWALLMAAGILLAAVFWLQRTPSKEELWAYRMGYGMGQALRANGGNVDPDELAAEMGIDANGQDMFEVGFKDGRKGRMARYDAPENFGQPSEPGAGGAYVEPPSLEEDQSESAAGDYAINSMYGEAPAKPEPKQETPEE
jgi:hypothetical protein